MRRSKKQEKFNPIKTIGQRIFRKNKGRNLVAVLAIVMTTSMFTTLFTLAQSMSAKPLSLILFSPPKIII